MAEGGKPQDVAAHEQKPTFFHASARLADPEHGCLCVGFSVQAVTLSNIGAASSRFGCQAYSRRTNKQGVGIAPDAYSQQVFALAR
jgi:hypothetical protein